MIVVVAAAAVVGADFDYFVAWWLPLDVVAVVAGGVDGAVVVAVDMDEGDGGGVVAAGDEDDGQGGGDEGEEQEVVVWLTEPGPCGDRGGLSWAVQCPVSESTTGEREREILRREVKSKYQNSRSPDGQH